MCVIMDFTTVMTCARELLKKHVDTIDIVLVAQVLGPRGHDNPLQLNCSETEHFTVQEFNEIYQGIVDAGLFIRQVFFSELEFIQDIVNKSNTYLNTIVFNLCRNGSGMNKKAVIPAMCDLLGVRYTSSGSGQCALARNKWLYTTILESKGIRVPKSSIGPDELKGKTEPSTLVIGKPNNESASQGVDITSVVPLEIAYTRFDKDTLVQEYIDGYECEVPIFTSGGQCFAMDPVGISFGRGESIGILSYQDSMTNNYDFYCMSDIIPMDICEKIKRDAEKSFTLLGLQKYGRIDFRVDKDSYQHFVIDVATTPYITRHSTFAYAVSKNRAHYPDIFSCIVASVC